MSDLPEELKLLRLVIDAAKDGRRIEIQGDSTIEWLKGVIRRTADEAPDRDIIRIAEFVLKRGIEMHQQDQN